MYYHKPEEIKAIHDFIDATSNDSQDLRNAISNPSEYGLLSAAGAQP